jgi:hypothetical protein
MALFKNLELWHVKVVHSRPNRRFSKERPTWEVQVRVYSKEQKAELEAEGLKLKAVIPDDGAQPYWKTNIKKKTIKRDDSPADPVEVVGGNMRPVDPNTIGNGSIGNVRVFQYDYTRADGSKGVASVLMGIQLTKHIVYTPRGFDDEFEEQEMEIVVQEEEEEGEEESQEADDSSSDGDDDEPDLEAGDGEEPEDLVEATATVEEDGETLTKPAEAKPKKTPSLKPSPKPKAKKEDKFD